MKKPQVVERAQRALAVVSEKVVELTPKKVLDKVTDLPGAKQLKRNLQRRAGAAVDRVVDALPLPVEAAEVSAKPSTIRAVAKKEPARGELRRERSVAAKTVREPAKKAGPKVKRGQKHR